MSFWAAIWATEANSFLVLELRVVPSKVTDKNPATRNSCRKGTPSFAPASQASQLAVCGWIGPVRTISAA